MTRRNPHQATDSNRYDDWMRFALEDMQCAARLQNDEDCLNGMAFHCQQSIEKALKAYILFKSDVLVDGHNLPWLCKRAMRYAPEFAQWLAPCTALTRCYIETRYPADVPLDLDSETALRYFQMSRSMYDFIRNEMQLAFSRRQAHPRQSVAATT